MKFLGWQSVFTFYSYLIFFYIYIVKILCFIAVILVLLLSIKPCCTDNDCSYKKTTVSASVTKHSPKKKECQSCSPFYSCGSCVGFIVTKTVSYPSFILPQKPVKHNNTYGQLYIDHVALSIWQPPRLG
jgi:hypothetical protein